MSLIAHSLRAPPISGPMIDALDRGFQFGDGVFDTMTAFGGAPFAWTRHRARLLKAAERLGIAVDPALLDKAIKETCAELKGRHAVIRATVTRGVSGRGLWPATASQPTILVTAQPWSADLVGQPARLVLASAPRNERSPLSRLKTLNYLDMIVAAREAFEQGADDALILNGKGRVACSSIANVFAIKDGRLLTPPLIDGVLDGVVRGWVLEEAPSLGLQPCEASLTLDDLLASEGVFLTNSVRLIRSVAVLQETPLPSSPLTATLLSRLREHIEKACGLPFQA